MERPRISFSVEASAETPFDNAEIVGAKSGRLCMVTDAFLRRGENEDLIFANLQQDTFAVIDGMGGHERGADAAQCVARAIEAGIKEGKTPRDMQIAASLLMRESGIRTGGACYIATTINGKCAKIWHAGDAGGIIFDEKGEVSFRSERNLIRAPRGNAVGSPVIEVVELHNYNRLLFASDGLWDNVDEQVVIDVARNMPINKAVTHLAQLARQGMCDESENTSGSPDNLSIFLYEILPASLRKSV